MNNPQEAEHQKEIEQTCEVCGEEKELSKSALCSQCAWELQQEEQKS